MVSLGCMWSNITFAGVWGGHSLWSTPAPTSQIRNIVYILWKKWCTTTIATTDQWCHLNHDS